MSIEDLEFYSFGDENHILASSYSSAQLNLVNSDTAEPDEVPVYMERNDNTITAYRHPDIDWRSAFEIANEYIKWEDDVGLKIEDNTNIMEDKWSEAVDQFGDNDDEDYKKWSIDLDEEDIDTTIF